jgi:hypothetical protein
LNNFQSLTILKGIFIALKLLKQPSGALINLTIMMIPGLGKSRVAFLFPFAFLAISLTISCSKDQSVEPASSAVDFGSNHASIFRGRYPRTHKTTTGTTGTTTGTTGTSGTTGTTTGTTGTTTGTTTGGSGSTGTTGTSSTSASFLYKASAPINLSGQSNITIRGDSINVNNGGTIGIHLSNCNNVHITKCKIMNSNTDGIQLSNCTNVTIDSCFISNVRAGVNAMFSVTVKVNNNQFLNMNGPFPSGNFVQFNNVSGGGCQINYNKCEDIVGVAQHPQDGLSVYQSNGLPGDSIMVMGNYIRGGQVLHDSGGAAGIVLGDVGGTYQVARYNVLVNPGSVGAQVQGGSHIKMDHNTIYSAATTYSVVGIAYGNYSGAASTDVTMSYNKIKYYQTSGAELDAWWDPGTASQPQGWSTNILNANINSSILPSVIITLNL